MSAIDNYFKNKEVYIIVKFEDFEKNFQSLKDAYVSYLTVYYEYPSTSGFVSEKLYDHAILLKLNLERCNEKKISPITIMDVIKDRMNDGIPDFNYIFKYY